MASKAVDARDLMVETIIAEMEAGTAPWQKDWKGEMLASLVPHNGTTNRPYSGMNALWLWLLAKREGYTSNRWATFNQIKAHGGNVKGQKSTPIVFFSPFDEDKRREGGPIGFWRVFNVFNFDQITGGDFPEAPPMPERLAVSEAVQALVKASGASIREEGVQPAYSPTFDYIAMPHSGIFDSPEAYAATLLHEMVHWTSHKSRLNREGGKRFGDDAYAGEELVAELGSFLLCSSLGVDYSPVQHGAYLKHWSRDDASKVRNALTDAKRAQDFLLKPLA